MSVVSQVLRRRENLTLNSQTNLKQLCHTLSENSQLSASHFVGKKAGALLS